ncbi:MAG: Holliday junction resolvase RuvX, partial [Pseudomonadota bacterium]
MAVSPSIAAALGMPMTALAEAAGSRGRLLALDLGTKTIGLAIASLETRLPTPLETIRRTKFTADAARIARLIEAEAVGGLVLGLPLNMDGSEGSRAQSTRSFALNLLRALEAAGLMRPLAFVDERLSSVAAEDAMEEAGLARARQRRHVDAAAAAEILRRGLAEMTPKRRTGSSRSARSGRL